MNGNDITFPDPKPAEILLLTIARIMEATLADQDAKQAMMALRTAAELQFLGERHRQFTLGASWQ